MLPKPALFERLCNIENLRKGFKSVKKNRGSPGIDGVTVDMFAGKLDEDLKQLVTEIESWSYKPSPVRRVEIPKPGKDGGIRLLGIPCVRDRVVQATLKELLEPLLDPTFSNSSYGFRPGRNQEQAIKAAQEFTQADKEFVVDIDLEKFFDTIGHDRLIQRLSCFIKDKRILRLIGIILRSGVMIKGLVSVSTEGSVQGSPISPLLSNVVLDELDKELEKRAVSFCRYADDLQVFVKSQKSAERVMISLIKFIEKKLKLKVNRKKSRIAKSCDVKFLGMTIVNKIVVISKSSINRAMQKVKELIPRGTHLPIEKSVEKINRWFVGWSNYYKMTQYPSQLHKIEAHIRRRLRARIVYQHKKRRNLYSKLLKLGVSERSAIKSVFNNNGIWKVSISPGMHLAYSNNYFIEKLGLKIRSEDRLKHWLGSRKVVRLG